MKSFVCVDFLVFSLFLLAITFGISSAELEQTKNRRGANGASGLFAFPRVGRSDPSLANSLHEADSTLDGLYSPSYEEYEELPKTDMKRASLIAFPRVGRSDAELRKWAQWLAFQQALDKRTGPSATSGLWFGPRLGKRSVNTQQEEKSAAKPKAQNNQY